MVSWTSVAGWSVAPMFPLSTRKRQWLQKHLLLEQTAPSFPRFPLLAVSNSLLCAQRKHGATEPSQVARLHAQQAAVAGSPLSMERRDTQHEAPRAVAVQLLY